MSLEMQVACKKIYVFFCVIMHPVPVPRVTASPIEMKFVVEVTQYLFSSVEVVHLE